MCILFLYVYSVSVYLRVLFFSLPFCLYLTPVYSCTHISAWILFTANSHLLLYCLFLVCRCVFQLLVIITYLFHYVYQYMDLYGQLNYKNRKMKLLTFVVKLKKNVCKLIGIIASLIWRTVDQIYGRMINFSAL